MSHQGNERHQTERKKLCLWINQSWWGGVAAAEQLQNTKNDFTGVTSGLRSVEEFMAGDLKHASRERGGGRGYRDEAGMTSQ